MLRALYDLPDLLVYALFMLASGGSASLVCRLGIRVLKLPDAKDHMDMAMRTSAAVVSALTLTLAFCAIQARTQHGEAERMVATEVAAIGGLARIADRLGEPGARLHEELNSYLASIIAAEFPGMADRGRHPLTQAGAETLEHAVYAAAGTIGDALASDLLQQADTVDISREDRLHRAATGLPRPFWLLILLLMGLLVATSALYQPRRHTRMMLAVQAAGVGALVAFVFLMDQPFRGHLSVTPDAYHALRHAIAHRAQVSTAIRRGLLVATPQPGPTTRLVDQRPNR